MSKLSFGQKRAVTHILVSTYQMNKIRASVMVDEYENLYDDGDTPEQYAQAIWSASYNTSRGGCLVNGTLFDAAHLLSRAEILLGELHTRKAITLHKEITQIKARLVELTTVMEGE